MGLLLDIVPNHMAASAENPWWMDVLENGAQSAFAAFFDVDWHPRLAAWRAEFCCLFSGGLSAKLWTAGEMKLIFNDGRFFFQYFESLFPVSPRSYHAILNLTSGA